MRCRQELQGSLRVKGKRAWVVMDEVSSGVRGSLPAEGALELKPM